MHLPATLGGPNVEHQKVSTTGYERIGAAYRKNADSCRWERAEKLARSTRHVEHYRKKGCADGHRSAPLVGHNCPTPGPGARRRRQTSHSGAGQWRRLRHEIRRQALRAVSTPSSRKGFRRNGGSALLPCSGLFTSTRDESGWIRNLDWARRFISQSARKKANRRPRMPWMRSWLEYGSSCCPTGVHGIAFCCCVVWRAAFLIAPVFLPAHWMICNF